jgi:RNA polymerase sigma factor for flagellar operon FliA
MEKPDPQSGTRSLVESHLGYAHAIAADMLKTLPPSVDRADLESAAVFGLLQAANAYDPSRGISFATFAYYRIRGAMYDDLRRACRASNFKEAANCYMLDYSSQPAPAAEPEAEYLEVKRITSNVITTYLLSLESMPREPGDRLNESPLDRLLGLERQKQLREALSRLPERNRKVMEGYYFSDLSFSQIGQELGLSESSAWRIHAKSLEMLRSILDEKTTKQSTPDNQCAQGASFPSPVR